MQSQLKLNQISARPTPLHARIESARWSRPLSTAEANPQPYEEGESFPAFNLWSDALSKIKTI